MVVADVVMERMIIISIYPLILTIKKSNNLYSKRKLTEYFGRDTGLVVGLLLLSIKGIDIQVTDSMQLFSAIIFSVISFAILFGVDNGTEKIEDTKTDVNILKYIFKDKMSLTYLAYYFIGTIAFATALGLKMITLVNNVGFTDKKATTYFLIVGILADIIGVICLKKLQPKNDYITVTIKFGIRCLGYMIVFISNSLTVLIIAITWSLLISTAYENVTDAPYINNIDNKYQLSFINLRYLVGSLEESIGILLCGILYVRGFRYMFGISALLLIIQILLMFNLIKQRKTIEIINTQ